MNSDAALSALEIARRHYSSDNYSSALRFCKKSIALHSTPEAVALLARIEKADAAAQTSGTSSATSNPPSNSTTSARPTPRASTSKPAPPREEKAREYTPAQLALVKRVKACRVTQYYEILAIEKGCSDSDVKKAYRKLALGLHPDKCGAPGAEEAFKMVSKAFQVLSDGNKRAVYDQTGSDPDSRGGGGGGGGGFSRGGGFGGGAGGFGGDEMTAEEIFARMFNTSQFGGGGFGGGGSPFGGEGFQFFGPGGVHMSTGGRRPGQQRQGGGAGGGQQAQAGSVWLQIAPLLVLFLFSLLTQLPSLFGTSTPADPDFAWESMPRYTVPRQTSTMGVTYFVNPAQFAQHPIYESYIRANPHLGFTSSHEPGSAAYRNDLTKFIRLPQQVTSEGGTAAKVNTPANLAKFERTVERSYIHQLQQICRQEIQNRHERLDRAKGFLGFGADWTKVREITAEPLPRCAELRGLGYNVQYD